MNHVTTNVGVLDKSLALVSIISHQPLNLTALTAQSGYNKATTHRLAAALETHGILRRDNQGRYCLGPRLIGLGETAAKGLPLHEVARPSLVALAAQTGESAQLYVRQGEFRVCIDAVESTQGLRTIVAAGALLELGLGSAGKILLCDSGALALGYAQSFGEREPGVASVSVPIMDSGQVVAALSVSGPIERFGLSPFMAFGDALKRYAQQIQTDAGLNVVAGQGA